jgi:hypothetical protein
MREFILSYAKVSRCSGVWRYLAVIVFGMVC